MLSRVGLGRATLPPEGWKASARAIAKRSAEGKHAEGVPVSRLVRRDRRARAGLPEPSHRRRLAVCLAGCERSLSSGRRSRTRGSKSNHKIKRRSDVVGIFPNEAAITKLIGALLLGQSEEWAVQRARYMTLETIAPLSDGFQGQPASSGSLQTAQPCRKTPLLHHAAGHDPTAILKYRCHRSSCRSQTRSNHVLTRASEAKRYQSPQARRRNDIRLTRINIGDFVEDSFGRGDQWVFPPNRQALLTAAQRRHRYGSCAQRQQVGAGHAVWRALAGAAHGAADGAEQAA
jgi:hypothetical protein